MRCELKKILLYHQWWHVQRLAGEKRTGDSRSTQQALLAAAWGTVRPMISGVRTANGTRIWSWPYICCGNGAWQVESYNIPGGRLAGFKASMSHGCGRTHCFMSRADPEIRYPFQQLICWTSAVCATLGTPGRFFRPLFVEESSHPPNQCLRPLLRVLTSGSGSSQRRSKRRTCTGASLILWFDIYMLYIYIYLYIISLFIYLSICLQIWRVIICIYINKYIYIYINTYARIARWTTCSESFFSKCLANLLDRWMKLCMSRCGSPSTAKGHEKTCGTRVDHAVPCCLPKFFLFVKHSTGRSALLLLFLKTLVCLN